MSKKIEVISTTGCGKCRLLKQWMGVKGLEFEERNITFDDEASNLLREAGLTMLPQVRIDGEFITYRDYNDILKLL